MSFEKISRPAWNSLMKILATLVSWIERKIRIYIYIYKKLYKCQRLVLFVGSKPTREWINSLSFSLSLPLTPFVRRQSCDLFKEEIHSRPYDIRFGSMQRIYPVVTTDHNSSSTNYPLRCVCTCVYAIEKPF